MVCQWRLEGGGLIKPAGLTVTAPTRDSECAVKPAGFMRQALGRDLSLLGRFAITAHECGTLARVCMTGSAAGPVTTVETPFASQNTEGMPVQRPLRPAGRMTHSSWCWGPACSAPVGPVAPVGPIGACCMGVRAEGSFVLSYDNWYRAVLPASYNCLRPCKQPVHLVTQ